MTHHIRHLPAALAIVLALAASAVPASACTWSGGVSCTGGWTGIPWVSCTVSVRCEAK